MTSYYYIVKTKENRSGAMKDGDPKCDPVRPDSTENRNSGKPVSGYAGSLKQEVSLSKR